MLTFLITLALALASPVDALPPCPTEDGYGISAPCLWDADKQGNGIGQSLINYPNGTFEYVG